MVCEFLASEQVAASRIAHFQRIALHSRRVGYPLRLFAVALSDDQRNERRKRSVERWRDRGCRWWRWQAGVWGRGWVSIRAGGGERARGPPCTFNAHLVKRG